jgi:phage terminase small subunit
MEKQPGRKLAKKPITKPKLKKPEKIEIKPTVKTIPADPVKEPIAEPLLEEPKKQPPKRKKKRKTTARPRKIRELTKKQQQFADKYIQLGNAERAAVEVGYSKAYARSSSYLLMENKGIARYIKDRMKELQRPEIAKEVEVLTYYTDLMRGKIKDQFDLDAPLCERTKGADALAKIYGSFSDKFKQKIEERKLKILEEKEGISGGDNEEVVIIDDIKDDE